MSHLRNEWAVEMIMKSLRHKNGLGCKTIYSSLLFLYFLPVKPDASHLNLHFHVHHAVLLFPHSSHPKTDRLAQPRSPGQKHGQAGISSAQFNENSK
jgi:hypothetical protein